MDKIDSSIYKDLIGKPFKYFGRGPEQYDCLGLMYELYDRLGIIMPQQASVIDKKLRASALEDGKEMFEKIEKSEPGCFIGFNYAGYVAHVGMMLDNVRFIHIQNKKRVCIEKINDLKWKSRIDGFYHFIGENNE